MKLREIMVEIGVEADEEEINNFRNALDNAKSEMASLAKQAAGVGAAIAGALGGLAAFTARESEIAEEFVRVSEAFDLGIDRYQELRFAFQSLNASSDDLHDVFGKLQNRSMRAAEGAQAYQKAFNSLNIEYEHFQQLSPEEQFDTFLAKAREAAEEGHALAGMTQILGSDLARRLLPGIADTSGAMERYVDVAREGGLVIEEELLTRATEAQFSFRLLGATINGLVRNISVRLAPAFQRLSESITNAILVVTDYMHAFGDGLNRVLNEEFYKFATHFRSLNDFVTNTMGGWGNLVKPLIASLGMVITFVTGKAFVGAFVAVKAAMAAAAGVLGVSMLSLAGIILAVGAAVISIGFYIEDFLVLLQGGTSMLTTYLEQAGEKAGGLAAFFDMLINAFRAGIAIVAANFGILATQIGDLFGEMGELIMSLWPIIQFVGLHLMAWIMLVVNAVLLGLNIIVALVRAVVVGLTWVADGLMGLATAVLNFLRPVIELVDRLISRLGGLIGGLLGVGEAAGELEDAEAEVEVKEERDGDGEEPEDTTVTEHTEVSRGGRVPGDTGPEGGGAGGAGMGSAHAAGQDEVWDSLNVPDGRGGGNNINRSSTINIDGNEYHVTTASPQEAAREIDRREEDRLKKLEDNFAYD